MKATNRETRRLEDIIGKCLKYGAEFERAMISAGYRELSCPDVVATTEYIDWCSFE